MLVRKFLSDLLLWLALLQLWYFHYKKKKAIIKFKVLEFAFAHDDLFSQGTHISSGPWLRKHKMVQSLTWQDQMSCMLCCFRYTSRATAPNSHLNSTFLETWQQQRYKLMMKLLEKKHFQINPRKMADILLSLKWQHELFCFMKVLFSFDRKYQK